MCLITFALDAHPAYSLILAANRDEFYERPTAYAHPWEEAPHVIGGRDLLGGGTWLGATQWGKISAVTNYRDPKNIRPDARTRGDLTKDFLLTTSQSAREYLQRVRDEAHEYNGFNLLLFEAGEAYHFSNYEGKINRVEPGIHGLSNALLNTPWPKLQRLKESFAAAIQGEVVHENLLQILEDTELAPDDELPDTGIGYEWEKAISSICIDAENYGTCCSTVITIDRAGNVAFTERSFPVGQRENKVVKFAFEISEANF